MTLAERLTTGLNITVLGMGLVFVLLALLWALLTVMLRLDRPPAAGPGEGVAPARPDARKPVKLPPELLSAITVAVFTHQAVLRKQAAPAMRSHWPGSILFASRWVAAGRHQQTQSWNPRAR
jgi:glutaconyl-CoA/methylmalonyl-CoA decarboxylase subunit delta